VIGWLLATTVLLTGCTQASSPYYYCWQVQLHHPDGRKVDALECIPRERKVPWRRGVEPAKDLFSAASPWPR